MQKDRNTVTFSAYVSIFLWELGLGSGISQYQKEHVNRGNRILAFRLGLFDFNFPAIILFFDELFNVTLL